MFALILALQMAAPLKQAMPAKDSSRLVSHIRDVEKDFFLRWRRDWADGQLKQKNRLREREDTLRKLALTCTNPELWSGGGLSSVSSAMLDYYGTVAHPHLIRNPGNTVMVTTDICPIWVSGQDEPADSRRGVDEELGLIHRSEIEYLYRRPLVAMLDSAAASLPGDAWIAGQRVRMHFDQGDLRGARAAADECKASASWCTMLVGLNFYWVGDMSQADALFQDALAVMADSDRCQWSDISALLTDADRKAYAAMTCEKRDSVNARFWWLADPLFLEEGNERRAEDIGRKVLIAIHSSMDLDERWDWRERKGGIAHTELIERYGWPTQMRYWGGMFHAPSSPFSTPNPGIIENDGNRGAAIAAADLATREALSTIIDHNNVLSTTIEYWGPQFHTVPPLSMVARPFAIADSNWQIGPERMSKTVWDSTWWAPEFYRRDAGPILGLENQIGFFRRAHGILLAAAAAWGNQDFVPAPRRIAFGAATTMGPEAGMNLSVDTTWGWNTGAILTGIRPGSQLLGLEMMSAQGQSAARRARFGITPPDPLSAIPAGTMAVSDPLLLMSDAATINHLGLGDALSRMLPSTVLRDPKKIALFWEVYGLPPGDSADVSLQVVRHDPPGVAKRALNAVGIGGGRDSVAVTWRMSGAASDFAAIDSGVTIRPVALGLDLSFLAAGGYDISIVVNRAGSPIVRARRSIKIVR